MQAKTVKVAVIWEGCIILIFVFFLFDSLITARFFLHKDSVTIIMLSLLCVDLFGLAVGLLRMNIPRYLIGDTVNHAITPLVYLCGYRYFSLQKNKGVKFITITIFLIGGLYFFSVLSNAELTMLPPIYLMAFTLTYLFASVSLNITILALGFSVLLFQIIINSGRRTPFIQFLIVMVCSFVFFMKNASKRHKQTIVVVITFFLATLFLTKLLKKQSASYKVGIHRIIKQTSLTSQEKDLSTYNRFLEVHDVISTLYSKGTTSFLTGLGNGALWVRDKATSSSRNEVFKGKLHHIHILPASAFFRQGLPGLVVWIAFYITVATIFGRFLLKNKPCIGQSEIYYVASILFIMAILLGTLVKFKIIYNPLLGFLLSYMNVYRNN